MIFVKKALMACGSRGKGAEFDSWEILPIGLYI